MVLMKAEKRKTLILSLCALLVIAAALLLYAVIPHTDGTAANIKDANVEYKSVDKTIIIDGKKSCDITERITVGFRKSGINVGLSRNVSRVNKITRIVGGKKYVNTTINKLQLYSVTLNGAEEYSFVEERGDYYYINTGADGDYKQADFYVYEIHYRYDMSDDFIKRFDDFTFDIMDYGFRGAVGKFSAKITLPKEFLGDKSIEEALTFRTNGMSPLGYEAVNAAFDAETLTVSCSYGKLDAGNGLTMQLILPQGYFDNVYKPVPLYWATLAVTLAAAVAIALIIITSRYVRGVVVVPEFYPPEGFSPLDVARSYRGSIRSKDFAALIISWANKGLVSIRLKGKKRVILKKLKSYDCKTVTDYSKHERDFFNRLFGFSNVYDTVAERRGVGDGGKERLYKAVKALYKPKPEQTKELVIKRLAVTALSLVPLIMCIIWHGAATGNSSSYVMQFVLLFPLVAILVFIYIPMPLLFKIAWCAIFGGAPFVVVITTLKSVYDIWFLSYIAAAIFILGIASSLLVRSFGKEERRARGAVLGFKRFLVLAELDKLNALLEDNPEYFYDILPYCYVFGITKKMEKKFSALNVSPPKYFNGGATAAVCHSISSSMRSVCGGGSSFGSGGSGGGGGGGGGGGSSGGGGGGGGCGGR